MKSFHHNDTNDEGVLDEADADVFITTLAEMHILFPHEVLKKHCPEMIGYNLKNQSLPVKAREAHILFAQAFLSLNIEEVTNKCTAAFEAYKATRREKNRAALAYLKAYEDEKALTAGDGKKQTTKPSDDGALKLTTVLGALCPGTPESDKFYSELGLDILEILGERGDSAAALSMATVLATSVIYDHLVQQEGVPRAAEIMKEMASEVDLHRMRKMKEEMGEDKESETQSRQKRNKQPKQIADAEDEKQCVEVTEEEASDIRADKNGRTKN